MDSTPSDIIDRLDAEVIRSELDEIERRRDALRILYRVALARQRKPRQADAREEAADAR